MGPGFVADPMQEHTFRDGARDPECSRQLTGHAARMFRRRFNTVGPGMTIPELVVRAVSSDSEWELARDIRVEVFISEQGCPPDEEWDGFDGRSRHLLAWLGTEAIGVARWRTVTYAGRSVAKLERFAIRKDYRGRGLGRALILQTMQDARLAGFREYLVHAQTYLADLYADLGFVPEGETFVEAGLPHVRMHHDGRSDSTSRNQR